MTQIASFEPAFMPVGIFTAVLQELTHPLACLQHRTIDWLDHQLGTRECLDLDAASAPPIVGEYRAAAAMCFLQHEVPAGPGIPRQGIGLQACRS